MLQGVHRISSSALGDGVSQTTGCVMETTTAETMLMNSAVEVPPPHHQVYYTVTATEIYIHR